MTQNPFLPLVQTNELEETITWEDFQNPKDLFAKFALLYAVKGNTINDNIIKSSDVPRPEDRGKLWIKDSWPYGLFALIDGEYRGIYDFSGLPVNIPFLHSPFAPQLDYVREIDATELADYGITNTNSDAKKRMKWHIFEPPAIKI